VSQEFLAVLEYMEKEKGIDREKMLAAIEAALVSAARKSFGPAKDLRVSIDRKTGQIKTFASLRVVDRVTIPHDQIQLLKARAVNPLAVLGDQVEVEVTPKDFGRIAAQVFKQTINQQLRSIEKNMIFTEFKDRAGDIVTGVVRRFDRSDVIIDLGKFEAVMSARDRVPTEDYSPGERIRALVLDVDNAARGPEIRVSRSHPDFVRKLFELEVNELHDGTVEIKGMAREAGYRTKIAVWSKDDKVDPVGACVGLRGIRVKNIVRELNNEKIDLFKWSPNIRELVLEAMKPARLKNLEIDEAAKKVTVFVDEENLPLAVGRRGQNARLTSKLTGWEIDVQKAEVQVVGFEQQREQAIKQLSEALDIDAETATKLVFAGFASLEGLREASEQDLREGLEGALEESTINNLIAKVSGKSAASA
jgi:N utilization substance protein A